jgi:hypothetical protein
MTNKKISYIIVYDECLFETTNQKQKIIADDFFSQKSEQNERSACWYLQHPLFWCDEFHVIHNFKHLYVDRNYNLKNEQVVTCYVIFKWSLRYTKFKSVGNI